MSQPAQALAERDETVEVGIPAANPTPMQMAFQLVHEGRDFASVREMIELGKKMEADEAAKAFNVALTEAQAEMRPIAADAENPQTRSKYASYAALDRALRPIYTKHGFSLSFDEGDTDKPEHIRVLCYVAHIGGHTRTYRKDMPADGKGARGGDVMTKTHAAGAADTYGMRYILKKVFNVAVGEEDRDGNDPGSNVAVTDEQAIQLDELLQTTADKKGVPLAKHRAAFLKYMKVESVADIRAKDFMNAVAAINSTVQAK